MRELFAALEVALRHTVEEANLARRDRRLSSRLKVCSGLCTGIYEFRVRSRGLRTISKRGQVLHWSWRSRVQALRITLWLQVLASKGLQFAYGSGFGGYDGVELRTWLPQLEIRVIKK